MSKVGSQFCQILNSYSWNGQILFKVLHKWQNLAKYGHIEGNFQPNQAGSRRRKRVCQNHNQIEEKAKAKKVLNSNFGILNRIIELQSVSLRQIIM